MKELNLLFPMIPNLSGFIWEKSWNNRFEKCWSNPGENKGKIFIIEILRHLVVEYRRTRYVFPLNRTCAFQPDGYRPRLNCLTSWLNWFSTWINSKNNLFSNIMTHTAWFIQYESLYLLRHVVAIAYNVIMTSSLRKTKNDSYHRGTICNDLWRHMRSSEWFIKVLRNQFKIRNRYVIQKSTHYAVEQYLVWYSYDISH